MLEFGDDIEDATSVGHGELFEGMMMLESADRGLNVACMFGELEFAQLAVKRGATCYDSGLEWAIMGNYLDVAKYMLKCGVGEINMRLMEACKWGSLEMVELLIDSGADDIGAALHAACDSYDIAMVGLIMRKFGISPEEGLTLGCMRQDFDITHFMGAEKNPAMCRNCNRPVAAHMMEEVD